MIKRSANSILYQTYDDFEIIVIDDGSSDNTEEIIRSLRDPRIRYIRQDANCGPSYARNIGIKAARGKYIAFQDSDDVWVPDKLEKQMNIFRTSESEVGVVFSAIIRVFDKKVEFISCGKLQKSGCVNNEMYNWDFPIYIQSTVVHKDCFNRAGFFDERLYCYEDKDLFIRISKYYNFFYIDEALVISTLSVDSISKNIRFIVDSSLILYQKHYDGFKRHKKSFSRFLYMLGNSMMKLGNILEGKRYILMSIKYCPINLKAIFIFCLSFFGNKIYNFILSIYSSAKRFIYFNGGNKND